MIPSGTNSPPAEVSMW